MFKFKVGDKIVPIKSFKNRGIGTIIKIDNTGTFGKWPYKIHFDNYTYDPGDQHSFKEEEIKLVNSERIKERLGVK